MEGDRRREFVEGKCLKTPELRSEVEELLRIEDDAEDFFKASGELKFADFLEDERPEVSVGRTIGNYRILRELGTGGMGAVYLAERRDGEFRQQVAVKMLRREFNTAGVRRRFDIEKEIQAGLKHQHIAGLIDAGTTRDGIPFLVMEHIEGEIITAYCRNRDLSLKERLKLFNKVCEAVSFAHRNLVVHRDLKPSNILVTGDGEPKLLDFGIAKLLTDDFEQSQTVTRLGVMTPEYASPEQVKRESATTATDIYSLGVILFELLTERLPFEKEFRENGNIFQAILEAEPEKPSVVVESDRSPDLAEGVDRKGSASAPPSAETGTRTQIPGGGKTVKLIEKTGRQNAVSSPKLLRGDLDNIILKTLRKEPERRYRTVEQLAADIWRHLDGLPVTARPATLGYRTAKFLRRHRYGVMAAALILLTIIGGIAATIRQSQIALVERDRARSEAAKAEKMSDFMQNILSFSNPSWMSSNPEQNRRATVSEAMDEALKNIETDLAGEPEIEAQILFTLSKTYVYQGQLQKGERVLRRAMEKFDLVHGAGNPRSMQVSVVLADALYLQGDLEQAEKLYLDAIEFFRPEVEKDKSQAKWLAIALNDLGNIYALRRNLEGAAEVYGESLKLAENLAGKDRFMLTMILMNIGIISDQGGDFQTAMAFYNRGLEELRRTNKLESLEAGVLLRSIGKTHMLNGQFETAENFYKEAFDLLRVKAGDENFFTLSTMYNRADNFYRQGKFERAEELIGRTLRIQNGYYPNGHYTIAFSKRLLGDIYTKTGRLKEGERKIREAWDYLSQNRRKQDYQLAVLKTSLGANLLAQKRGDEAAETLRSALADFIRTNAGSDPEADRCRRLLTESD